MAEGDPAHRPTLPSFPNGWLLGEPGLVVTPERPFVLKAQENDVYRNLVLRTSVPATK